MKCDSLVKHNLLLIYLPFSSNIHWDHDSYHKAEFLNHFHWVHHNINCVGVMISDIHIVIRTHDASHLIMLLVRYISGAFLVFPKKCHCIFSAHYYEILFLYIRWEIIVVWSSLHLIIGLRPRIEQNESQWKTTRIFDFWLRWWSWLFDSVFFSNDFYLIFGFTRPISNVQKLSYRRNYWRAEYNNCSCKQICGCVCI